MEEVALALLGVLIAIWFAWRWHITYRFSRAGVPGPAPSLLFGNIIELFLKGPNKCHQEWVKKYGPVVGYYYGMKPVLLVADPQLLKQIYIKDFSKFMNREPFNPLIHPVQTKEINQSVLILRDQKWKEVRSVLTPTFSTAKMKKMAMAMNSSIDTMLDIMREKAKAGEIFNIHDTYQRLTMDVISKTAFGVQLDIQRNEKSSILSATKLIFGTSYRNALVFIGLVFPLLRRMAVEAMSFVAAIYNRGVSPIKMLRIGLKNVLLLRRAKKEFHQPDLLQLLIDTKVSLDSSNISLKSLEAGDPETESAEAEEPEGDSSKVVRNMTNDEIIASSVTVFLAGYETTSTALAFTTYLLAKHPDIQERIFNEIEELISNGNKLEYGSINKLPYLDKVLNESLRIYPPVYLFTNRYASEDITYGSLRIPKDTIIQAPAYIMHHNEEYWPEPETFDPDRFDVRPNANGITFLPFGIGPRNCLGMRFAQMEAKLALAHVLYNFKIHVAKEQKDDLPVTLMIRTITPANGVRVKLEEREK